MDAHGALQCYSSDGFCVGGTCALFTEPKAGEYSVRQIVKFGEFLLIPAGDSTVEFPTENL